MIRNTYRTKNELKTLIRKTSTTTIDRYMNVVKNHPERYGENAVFKASRSVLIDEDAFMDAYKYEALIALGIAPEYRRGVAV